MSQMEERTVRLGGTSAQVGTGRGRDGHTALARVIEALADRIRSGHEGGSLRTTFEGALQEALGASRVRLRASATAYPMPVDSAPARRVSVHVPTASGTPPAILEATLDEHTPLSALDSRVLGLSAELASLVLEVDRCQMAGTCSGPLTRRAEAAMPSLVGTSPAMLTLRDNIARVAGTDFIVLVEGESGTGKELVARQIHQLSHRRHGPFVAVNCAAIVESLLEAELFGIEDRTATGVRGRRGKFEHADGGTLFLDEVSDLAPAAQAKLLRAIQELTVERVGGHATRKVDTRIVVATNRSLRELVSIDRFREDLFYRLSGVELHVPPLRARRQDIPDLCTFFLSRYQTPRPVTLGAEAAHAMQLYGWPGNVRELERTIEGAVALAVSGTITFEDLPKSLRGEAVGALQDSLDHQDSMRTWGARYARLMLQRFDGNKRKTCDVLDISYHTLVAYLRWKPRSQSTAVPEPWSAAVRAPAGSSAEAATRGEVEGTLCV